MKNPTPARLPVSAAAPASVSELSARDTERLEQLLALLIEHHRAMLAHTAEHRSALAKADPGEIARCVAQQHADAERFAALEGVRAELFRSPGFLGPRPVQPVTLSTVMQRVAKAPRDRLGTVVATLRGLAQELEAQRRALRLATETLLGHMQGLISHVSRALSPTGTYARPNAHAGTPQVLSGLDLLT
ncbi:MAG: flagellar export chaperone FlgN [Phycisphaerales bacterium]